MRESEISFGCQRFKHRASGLVIRQVIKVLICLQWQTSLTIDMRLIQHTINNTDLRRSTNVVNRPNRLTFRWTVIWSQTQVSPNNSCRCSFHQSIDRFQFFFLFFPPLIFLSHQFEICAVRFIYLFFHISVCSNNHFKRRKFENGILVVVKRVAGGKKGNHRFSSDMMNENGIRMDSDSNGNLVVRVKLESLLLFFFQILVATATWRW